MSESDGTERMVPNPMIPALHALLGRVEAAADNTPSFDGPAESIGGSVGDTVAGKVWTGTKAREVHDNYLAPWAPRLRRALEDVVDDVAARLAELPEEVPEGVAEAIRADLQSR